MHRGGTIFHMPPDASAHVVPMPDPSSTAVYVRLDTQAIRAGAQGQREAHAAWSETQAADPTSSWLMIGLGLKCPNELLRR